MLCLFLICPDRSHHVQRASFVTKWNAAQWWWKRHATAVLISHSLFLILCFFFFVLLEHFAVVVLFPLQGRPVWPVRGVTGRGRPAVSLFKDHTHESPNSHWLNSHNLSYRSKQQHDTSTNGLICTQKLHINRLSLSPHLIQVWVPSSFCALSFFPAVYFSQSHTLTLGGIDRGGEHRPPRLTTEQVWGKTPLTLLRISAHSGSCWRRETSAAQLWRFVSATSPALPALGNFSPQQSIIYSVRSVLLQTMRSVSFFFCSIFLLAF